jgi:phage baseplate assembly protein gpV
MTDNRSTLHQGQATERNVKSASARVGFDDLAMTVSGYMQVLFPAAGGWNMFYTPKEGDQVVVGRLQNGSEEGYILGKVYTAGKMPQGGAPNIILLVSDNGKNIVKFDADKGTLDLVCDQTGTLKFKNLNIEVNEHTSIKTKTFRLEAEESVEIESGTTTDITAGDDISVGTEANINTVSNGHTNVTAIGNISEVAGGSHTTKAGGVIDHV